MDNYRNFGALTCLSGLYHLEHLELCEFCLAENSLRNLPRLQILELKNCDFSLFGGEHSFKPLRGLRKLTICNPINFTHLDFSPLVNLQDLTFLSGCTLKLLETE